MGRRSHEWPDADVLVFGATVRMAPSRITAARDAMERAQGPLPDDATFTLLVRENGRVVKYAGTRVIADPTLEGVPVIFQKVEA